MEGARIKSGRDVPPTQHQCGGTAPSIFAWGCFRYFESGPAVPVFVRGLAFVDIVALTSSLAINATSASVSREFRGTIRQAC